MIKTLQIAAQRLQHKQLMTLKNTCTNTYASNDDLIAYSCLMVYRIYSYIMMRDVLIYNIRTRVYTQGYHALTDTKSS